MLCCWAGCSLSVGPSMSHRRRTYLGTCLFLCWMLQVREYLEKHYAETSGKETIKLVLKSLMETVEAGSKNVEVRLRAQHTVSGTVAALSPSQSNW